MKKKFSEKLGKTNNETQNVKSPKGSKFLITINVLGSAGPLRFVVNGDDLVAGVIDTALKSYARGGRLPVLGSDVNDFVLYSADAGFDGIITFPFARISTHQFFASYVVNKTSAFSTLMNKIFPRILCFKSERTNKFLWGKELCAVQEAEAATDDRSEVGDDSSEAKWKLESLAEQVLQQKDIVQLSYLCRSRFYFLLQSGATHDERNWGRWAIKVEL
ncbi:hypothetical protein CJ030_MR6G021508 [Morella rubra]|uniref:DUF7054 domain-containing protein n=1 Tax=Morella rubra TaxID=262757 RepID=A0A6A1VEK9_9ROSI|nr:hypothetical protein CJ030_MR6G021508 [Morella rubra]